VFFLGRAYMKNLVLTLFLALLVVLTCVSIGRMVAGNATVAGQPTLVAIGTSPVPTAPPPTSLNIGTSPVPTAPPPTSLNIGTSPVPTAPPPKN
jgi:hypothetical protein